MRVLLIGGCLGLGSLIAQALVERGLEVIDESEYFNPRFNNPHHVTAEMVGLGIPSQFEQSWAHSDLWRDRAVEVWYDLPELSAHQLTARVKPAPASPLPHVRGTCLV